MKSSLSLKVVLLGFIFPCYFSAAGKSSVHSIEWQANYEKKFSEESTFRSLSFKGASYDANHLPQYVISVPLEGTASSIRVVLNDVVVEPVRDVQGVEGLKEVGNDFKITSTVLSHKKKPIGSVSILPVRKNSAGGFERLLSFSIDVQPVFAAARLSQARTYAPSSVLADGEWHRIGVLFSGVHKINYMLLKSMGIDVDNIDPAKIRIYGNGGGMLPFANNKFRHDDLQENAIFIAGESDGQFNANDYILFYGSSQTKWNYDPTSRQFNHAINLYSDTTYYFLTIDATGNGKRIQSQASVSGANRTVTTYDDYEFHQAELYNFLKSGREWYGESMDYLNNSIEFTTSIPNLVAGDTIFLRSNLGGRTKSDGFHTFSLKVNGNNLSTQSFGKTGVGQVTDPHLVPVTINSNFLTGSNNFSISYHLSSSDPNIQGWLNYYELNYRRTMDAAGNGGQFIFRDKNSVGMGNISEFRISNTTTNYTYWEITDPLNIKKQDFSFAGGVSNFTVNTDMLREFIAFDGNQFLIPVYTGMIDNQNLHALAQAEMLIVTNPLFLQQAYDLAEFHRIHDNLSVVVATTRQIFNEFSSGAQDVSAIRDFVKMFYDRATNASELPRFLLLFGDASYDNKYRIAANTNFVTSYQSANSISPAYSYMSDDFFGLLDDNEGEWSNSEIVDISVGRMPVKNTVEASAAVAKIKHYVNGSGATSGNPTLGNWRNSITFVGDDKDGNLHVRQADTLALRVKNDYPEYNIDKIYLDAFNQISTPGGERYPDAHKALVDRVQRGTLLITYIGHGNELGWAHEDILSINDINNWTNFNQLAAFVTATCEFTRVDDPGRTSAGEMVYLNPGGGAICMFTTSRLAYAHSNFNLLQKFFTHVLDESSGQFPTSGEVFERTKVDYYSDPNVRNFLLIGDPAVRLAYPKFNVKTKTINGIDISMPTDTLKALSKVTITGEVTDAGGNIMTGFNGIIYPTVYDKFTTYSTLGNDQGEVNFSYPQTFQLQKNIIYSGKASVTNGAFSFSFVVPKDIAFQYGKGKISYYAQNGHQDAGGFDSIIVVGGVNSSVASDGEGPKIQLYINDEKFVRGGMTDKHPILYAIVQDSSGINTVGTGIGHDMTAELDEKSEKKYILNDFYENDLDSYQSGKVRYQFKDLEPGPHSLTFKVWDVHNNSSMATTDFVVSESAELALDHVLNYPNPFTTHTTFMFEHNKPFIQLDVQVQIFTVSGRLIKTISDRISPQGYRSDSMQWDGLDDFGDRIGRGVYVYRLRVKSADGQYADKFEKLVILR